MSAVSSSNEAVFPEQSLKNTALKVALIYAGISVLWILFSDQLLAMFIKDVDIMTRLQMVKGWFFVLATSYIIYLLLKNDLKQYIRIQNKLQHSQDYLQTLMDALPIAVSWADDTGNIRYSNNKFIEVFGYTPQDAPTIERWFQLAYPDRDYRQEVADRWEKAVQNAQASGSEITPIEATVTCKDGSKRQIAIIGALLKDRILGVFNDLTASKQSEKALEESENRYRTLFESANDGIFILRDKTFIECNQKILEMFGCRRDQIIGQTPYDFSPPLQPDGRDSAQKALEKIEATIAGQPDVFEWRHTQLNGEAFDAEISLSLTNIESETLIQAIVRDISVRKKLDQEVQLLHRWVEQSVDLFFWVGEDSRVLYVNKAAQSALGYSLAELCSMQVADFDLEITHAVWPEFTDRLKKMENLRFETRMRKKDGSTFPVEITANSLRFENKDHFFAYGRDISGRVKAEADRKKLELQLGQAQKMEAIGTLAGGIAHDFNNILSSVLGFAELAKLDLPEGAAESKDCLDQVIKAGLRAKDLVQHILTFSRRTESEKYPLQMPPLVKEVGKLLHSTLPASIEVRFDIENENLFVLGDPSQIHQILMNLCVNAVHAMTDDGGVLTIGLQRVPAELSASPALEGLAPGEYVEITVSDTGPGIPAEIMDWIFDPFFTTKPRGKGTGMGLSVVHGIIKSMDGAIQVESDPGRETVFRVILPLHAESVADAGDQQSQSLPKGKGRILFVDNEKEITIAISQLLRKIGYDVDTETDGLAAVEKLTAQTAAYDLVITDLDMPGISGIELSKQVRKIWTDIPIILCTGFSREFTRAELDEIGLYSMIRKPVIVSELAAAVSEAINANKTRD